MLNINQFKTKKFFNQAGGSVDIPKSSEDLTPYENMSKQGLFLPTAGERISLTKSDIKGGEITVIEKGESMIGTLHKDVSLGAQVIFNNGGRTSEVYGITIDLNNHAVGIETRTSYYEMSWKNKGEFSIPSLPKAGDTVRIIKISLDQDKESKINTGDSFKGILISDVQGGHQMILKNDLGRQKTSPVKSLVLRLGENGEKQIGFKTQTSLYVIKEWIKC